MKDYGKYSPLYNHSPVQCQAQVTEAEEHDVPIRGLNTAAVSADHGLTIIVGENVTNIQDHFRRVKYKEEKHWKSLNSSLVGTLRLTVYYQWSEEYLKIDLGSKYFSAFSLQNIWTNSVSTEAEMAETPWKQTWILQLDIQ